MGMRWSWFPLVGAGVAVVMGATSGGAALDAHPQATSACSGFDFPVGPPDASGYYDAQPFGINDHLGSDWNGDGGGDTDLGDPVHAIAAGVISEATNHGGGDA